MNGLVPGMLQVENIQIEIIYDVESHTLATLDTTYKPLSGVVVRVTDIQS